jgi:hypothetical protein
LKKHGGNTDSGILLENALKMLPENSNHPFLTQESIKKYIHLVIETYINQKEKNMEVKLDNNNFCLIGDELYPIGFNNGKILIPDEENMKNYQFRQPILEDNNLFKTYEDFKENISNIMNSNIQSFSMK